MAAIKAIQKLTNGQPRTENTNSLFRSQDMLKNVLLYFTTLGFQGKHVYEAWKNTNHRQNLMLDELIRLSSSESAQKGTKDFQIETNQTKESDESLVRQAIALSLKTQSSDNTSEEFIRQDNKPVGLINLGRTCYFNIVIQTLFNIKKVRNMLMEVDCTNSSSTDEQKNGYLSMVKEFQILFGALLEGNKSWQNPKGVFESLRKLSGDCFRIGEENDFWEFFNCTFDILENSITSIYDIQKQTGCSAQRLPSTAADDSILINIDQNFFSHKKTMQAKEEQTNEETEENGRIKKIKTNLITEMFFGTAQECITYSDGSKEVKKYNESIQGIMSLEVQHGDLYKALSAAQVFEIPDYEISEGGGKTMARVENKMKKSPEILNFYINRLDFDRKLLQTVKRNDSFYFDKTLNLDNFTVSEDQLQEAAKLSLEDQLSLEKIDRQIKRIESYQEKQDDKVNSAAGLQASQAELSLSIERVINFLGRQTPKTDDFTNLDDYDMNLDDANGDFKLASEEELKRMNLLLSKYQERLANQTETLNSKLEALRKERSRLYKKSQNENVYNVFSILMHEGKADSGHYFCYIYSEDEKKWYKYNDSIVTEAQEEELLKEAYGKPNSTRNACCVIYRRARSDQMTKKDEELEKETPLPESVRSIVQEMNKDFFRSLDKQRIVAALDPFKIKLNTEVQNRLASIMELQKKKSETISGSNSCIEGIRHFISFDTFLLSQSENNQAYKLGIREIVLNLIKQSDMTTLINELYGKEESLNIGFDEFFAQIKGIGNYSTPLGDKTQAELACLKSQHTFLNAITIELERLIKIGKSADDYPEMITGLIKVIGALNKNAKADKKNISLYSDILLNFAYQQATAQLLKGTFHLDCLFSSESSRDHSRIIQSILQGAQIISSNNLIKQQIIANLSYTLKTHGQNPRVFTNAAYKSFQANIDILKSTSKGSFPQQQTHLQYFEFNPLSTASLESIAAISQLRVQLLKSQQLNFKNNGLWSEFASKIVSTGKLISDAERLDKEELLYTDYL